MDDALMSKLTQCTQLKSLIIERHSIDVPYWITRLLSSLSQLEAIQAEYCQIRDDQPMVQLTREHDPFVDHHCWTCLKFLSLDLSKPDEEQIMHLLSKLPHLSNLYHSGDHTCLNFEQVPIFFKHMGPEMIFLSLDLSEDMREHLYRPIGNNTRRKIPRAPFRLRYLNHNMKFRRLDIRLETSHVCIGEAVKENF